MFASSFPYNSRYLSESDLYEESRAKIITDVVIKIESIDEDTVSWSLLKTPFLFSIRKIANNAIEEISRDTHKIMPVFDLLLLMIKIT